MRILLVEDDQEIREMLCSFLTLENFEVDWAADGETGCERFDTGFTILFYWI